MCVTVVQYGHSNTWHSVSGKLILALGVGYASSRRACSYYTNGDEIDYNDISIGSPVCTKQKYEMSDMLYSAYKNLPKKLHPEVANIVHSQKFVFESH